MRSNRSFPLVACISPQWFRQYQVLLNLLSNAVKYNCYQGRVVIKSKIIDQQRLRIFISDTGEGISEDQINDHPLFPVLN